MLNQKELEFVNSIENKIKKYALGVTLKDCLNNSSGTFIETTYNTKVTEIVDTGIERFICSISSFYFIKNYCYISVPNMGIIPFDLYYFQEELLKELATYKRYTLLKARQVGLSTVVSFYCLWRSLFRPSESIAIVSKKKDAAQDFIKKMKVTLDLLPLFLQQKVVSDNMSSIRFINESEIKSEARSPNAGRSSTLSLLVMDEAAFYGSEHMARSIVASAMPTLTRTGGSLILISTPNGMFGEGQYYFEQVQQGQMEGSTKSSKLLEVDWYEVPDMEGIYPQKGYNHILNAYIEKGYFHNHQLRQELKAIFKPIQENWKENPWLKAQYDVLGEAKFRQEILHDFVAMGSAVFNNEVLVKVSSRVKEPVIKNVLGNSMIEGLWIWRNPVPNHRYILAADVATGTSNDFSTTQVLDAADYEQVAEYHGHISTPNFGNLIKKVANYYNQAYVVVESNSIGEAVFNSLYYDEYEPYNNVFKQEKTKNNITRMTGWITDTKTRKLIVNEIIDWMTVDDLFNTLKIYSSRLYTELTTWIWNAGKAEHQESSHDDLIIAFALCLYLRNKATSSGSSFIIDEKGNTIAHDARLDTGKVDNGLYGILLEDGNTKGDFIEEKYGMSANDYSWLTGQR